ncbi:MAG: hypothetical protein BRD23_09880 [Halobacteriales archaeon SW_9_67_25]|jgi:hypothetical protein|nr:MAG: hypothetical protein BRD23_09880 [Halobacteriales archaeon SW_9_67_25]
MAESLTCPECGAEVASAEQLVAEHEVTEVEVDEDGSLNLFENRDLFLCKDCKNPLGIRQ